MAVDYDAGELSEREKKAGENQLALAKKGASNTKTQAQQQLANYDFMNAQNRQLADVELKQNSRKNEADRFEAMRDLQNSALGILGSLNQAGNSSTIYNLAYMLGNRNDADNDTYWTQLQTNNDAVNNAYDEAANQNQAAKNDVVINTQKALADMETDLAANLNNINPNLYVEPGTGDADLGASGYYDANKVDQHNTELSGYIMPDNSAQAARDTAPRNQVKKNDYFSRLINSYNGYR